MKADRQIRMVLVTCANRKEARTIARNVIGEHLAACVNIFPAPVESIYRWKGKIESAREILMVIKTTAKRLAALEREVKRAHSYDLPEFLALAIREGSPQYLAWVAESVSRSS